MTEPTPSTGGAGVSPTLDEPWPVMVKIRSELGDRRPALAAAIRGRCGGIQTSNYPDPGWRDPDFDAWADLADHYSFIAFVAVDWAVDWIKNWGMADPVPWLIRNVIGYYPIPGRNAPSRPPDWTAMSDAHTPGPWRAIYNQEIWTEDMNKCIATIDDYEDREGNARLIATAPELLAILKEMVVAVTHDPMSCNGHSECESIYGIAADARYIIAKAEGGRS